MIRRGKKVTCKYTGLHKATQGYIELDIVMWGHKGLHKATQGYMGIR